MKETIRLEKAKSSDKSTCYNIWVKTDYGSFNKSIRSLTMTLKGLKTLKGLIDKEFEKKKGVEIAEFLVPKKRGVNKIGKSK